MSISSSLIQNPPNEKQRKFLTSLLDQRVHSYTEAQISGMFADHRIASKVIGILLRSKMRKSPLAEVMEPPVDQVNWSVVVDGFYATRNNISGAVQVFQVITSRTGFKNISVQKDNGIFTRLFGRTVAAVLHDIMNAGVEESQDFYTDKTGRCHRCGRLPRYCRHD
jgi:hypothetical protein